MTRLPVEVVNESGQDFLAQTFPKETIVNLTKTAEFQGTSYAVGMMLFMGLPVGCLTLPKYYNTCCCSGPFSVCCETAKCMVMWAFSMFQVHGHSQGNWAVATWWRIPTVCLYYTRCWDGFSETLHLLIKLGNFRRSWAFLCDTLSVVKTYLCIQRPHSIKKLWYVITCQII